MNNSQAALPFATVASFLSLVTCLFWFFNLLSLGRHNHRATGQVWLKATLTLSFLAWCLRPHLCTAQCPPPFPTLPICVNKAKVDWVDTNDPFAVLCGADESVKQSVRKKHTKNQTLLGRNEGIGTSSRQSDSNGQALRPFSCEFFTLGSIIVSRSWII